MPSGFEDNTVMAEEVSEETDLVSEAMLPEEVITPKPPSRAGRGLIGNSDDLILLNPAVARGRLSKSRASLTYIDNVLLTACSF